MQEENIKTKSLQEPRNEMENIFQMSVIENKVRVVKRNWVIFSYLCGWFINYPGHGPDETFQATAHVFFEPVNLPWKDNSTGKIRKIQDTRG